MRADLGEKRIDPSPVALMFGESGPQSHKLPNPSWGQRGGACTAVQHAETDLKPLRIVLRAVAYKLILALKMASLSHHTWSGSKTRRAMEGRLQCVFSSRVIDGKRSRDYA